MNKVCCSFSVTSMKVGHLSNVNLTNNLYVKKQYAIKIFVRPGIHHIWSEWCRELCTCGAICGSKLIYWGNSNQMLYPQKFQLFSRFHCAAGQNREATAIAYIFSCNYFCKVCVAGQRLCPSVKKLCLGCTWCYCQFSLKLRACRLKWTGSFNLISMKFGADAKTRLCCSDEDVAPFFVRKEATPPARDCLLWTHRN
jgi:hypothetical protein